MSTHPGSRKVEKIAQRGLVEDNRRQALQKLQESPNNSIRSVAKEFGVNESTLRFRLGKIKNGEELKKSGRKCTFTKEKEEELVKCIKVACNYGFSQSIKEIQELVGMYVEKNNLVTQFKDGYPGKRWLRNFMARNKLTLNKSEMICSARMGNTSNPFIIYDFYDLLEKILKDNPDLSPDQIWNCVESGFPTDQSKGKVICEKGKRALKQRPGAGRENITVLAVCSAAGVALAPLIIFKGKNFQSSWIGEEALPNTFYGKSENGWMDTVCFAEWFEKFASQIQKRPLLLIFDGHMTHISLPVIQKALDENIILVKLPPHVTDVLQPLDEACFGPVKRRWEQLLQERVNSFGARSALTKSDFVNLLSRVWKEMMKPQNIISGFSSTGIYPVNRDKYPVERFHKLKIIAYQKWKESREELNWDLIEESDGMSATKTSASASSTTEITKASTTNDTDVSLPSTKIVSTTNSNTISQTQTSTKWAEMTTTEKQIEVVGPYPYDAPPGFEWVPEWRMVKIGENATSTPKSDKKETSFEELYLAKIKPTTKTKTSRIKIGNKRGAIVSQEELLAQKEKKREKQRRIEEREAKKTTKERKRKRKESESSIEEEEEEYEEEDDEKEEVVEEEEMGGTEELHGNDDELDKDRLIHIYFTGEL